ncbi:endonuclease/exonuclease/phosphatase family protein [Austwickia chelonae]|uniref:endonuclease/exonuclease/phosphatase family protein n=1 Tax=Austwickia chelonae TaxID=100225 RepID=UPI0013C2F731|nr:endonuclease/exonuclease/phosphatase family protein [Austwickia chelonae]
MRKVRSWLLGISAAMVLLASTVWWWDLTGPVPMVQPLYPVVGPLAVMVLAVCAGLRYWRSAAAVMLSLILYATAMGPTVLPLTGDIAADPSSTGAKPLRILAANTEFGQIDVTALKHLVESKQTDVVVLTEAGPQFVPHARQALKVRLPHDSGPTLGGAGGTIVFSRFPMKVLDADNTDHSKPQQPVVRLDVGGRPVTLRGIHPRSPSSATKLPQWRADLAGLAQWQRGQQGAVVMVGDFNSSWAHPAFREVAEGFDDALRVTGQAWEPTWPVHHLIPAFAQIDHVLSRGLGVRDAQVLRIPRTDHLAVAVELTVP